MRLKLFSIALILSLPFWWGVNVFQKNLEKFFYAQISQPFQEMVFVKIPEKIEKPKLELNAKSAISLKINKNGREKLLFQKNSEEILPIASLTKLMTAVIVLENKENYNFEDWLTISPEAANQEDVPIYGNLKAGERLNFRQLLDLMLIYSSNDAAWALAEVIGPENFVKKMNEKVKELGLENTHFVKPHGLDPKDLHYQPETQNNFNYSTAKDLVKISQYILKEHPLIFEITRKEPPYRIKNGIFDLFSTLEVIGGKTGYTNEAGGCILFIFKNKEGSLFINLILGASSSSTRIEEMQKIIDWLNL